MVPKPVDPRCETCRKVLSRALEEMEQAREALHRLSTTMTVLVSHTCRRAAEENANDGQDDGK